MGLPVRSEREQLPHQGEGGSCGLRPLRGDDVTVGELVGLWWLCFSLAGVMVFGGLLAEDVVEWIRERRRSDDPE